MMGSPGSQVARDPMDLLGQKDFPVTRVQVDPMDRMEETVTQVILDPKALL